MIIMGRVFKLDSPDPADFLSVVDAIEEGMEKLYPVMDTCPLQEFGFTFSKVWERTPQYVDSVYN